MLLPARRLVALPAWTALPVVPALLLAACAALLAACGRPDLTEQSLLLEVHTLSAPPDLEVLAECTWLGEERRTPLRDDGLPPDAVAGDGIFTAAWTGAPVRMLPVRLLVTRAAEAPPEPEVGAAPVLVEAVPVEAYAGIEVLSLDDAGLAWSLELDAPPRARRVPVAASSREVAFLEAAQVGASLLWALLVVVIVLALVRRHEASPGAEAEAEAEGEDEDPGAQP